MIPNYIKNVIFRNSDYDKMVKPRYMPNSVVTVDFGWNIRTQQIIESAKLKYKSVLLDVTSMYAY